MVCVSSVVVREAQYSIFCQAVKLLLNRVGTPGDTIRC